MTGKSEAGTVRGAGAGAAAGRAAGGGAMGRGPDADGAGGVVVLAGAAAGGVCVVAWPHAAPTTRLQSSAVPSAARRAQVSSDCPTVTKRMRARDGGCD